MVSCSSITALTLDKESLSAIKRIKSQKHFAKSIGAAITSELNPRGVFHSIFTKNSSPIVAYNITQTDWGFYGQSMASLPKTQKALIVKEIDFMIIHYQLGKYDHKHVQFWKGMKYGCE